MNSILYWRSGAGYFALVEGDLHFSLDPQEFLNRATRIWPDKLFEIIPASV